MALNNTQKGLIFGFVGFNAYTFSDACAKWLGMENGYDVTTILFWNYLIVLCATVALAVPFGIKKSLGTKKPFIHLARSISVFFAAACVIAGLSGGLSLATLYTVEFMAPIVITIAAIPLYKEHVPKKSWFIVLLGFLGISVAFCKDASFSNPLVLYAFGVLFLCCTYSLLSRRIDCNDSVLTLPFYPALLVVVSLFIHLRGNIPVPSMSDMPVFVLRSFFVFFGIVGVAQAFRIGRHASVAPMQYTQMLSGVVAGYCIFGNIPDIWMLIGAGMIIVSGILLVTQNKH